VNSAATQAAQQVPIPISVASLANEVASVFFAIVSGGCGTATNRSNGTGTARPAGLADYAQAVEGSCATDEANGKPLTTSRVFVLADGGLPT
jgi:hypothetical protein